MIRLFLLVLPMAVPGVSLAQSVVPVHEEPMHRLVHEDPEFRVLDVLLPPGDTSLYHRHETPTAYVAIRTAPVNAQVFGEGWGTTVATSDPGWAAGDFAMEEGFPRNPLTHRVAAVGEVSQRLIVIPHLGPGRSGAGPPSLGSVGPVTQEGRWFRSATKTLGPSETLEWTRHDRPVIAVHVSGGTMSVEPNDRVTRTPLGAGDYSVLAAGQVYSFRNRSSSRWSWCS